MSTTTRKFISLYLPGSFMPEVTVREVPSFDIPAEVPRDCYAFRFHETEYATVDGKEFVGKTVHDPITHVIGKRVPFEDLPSDADHAILRSNIEINSPTKTGVKTHLGVWQMETENTQVHDPSRFAFGEPLIWKNIKSTAA